MAQWRRLRASNLARQMLELSHFRTIANAMPHPANRLTRSCGKVTVGLLPLLLLFTARPLIAQAQNGQPLPAGTVITNMAELWTLPTEEKNRIHQVHMEILIYYCNPEWSVFWGRSGELNTFLPLRGIPQTLHTGDKVRLDGLILPVDQKFIWDKTSINIISQTNALPCVFVEGKSLQDTNLAAHFIETTALVDSQMTTDPGIQRLRLLQGDLSMTAFLTLNDPEQVQTNLSGKYVRIKAVYMPASDSAEKNANITLWTPGLDCIEICGSLDTDPRFTGPIVSSENFAAADPRAWLRVAGIVRSQQPGQAVTIWDDAGQIRVLTSQKYPLELGDLVEAIGQPDFQGIDRILRNGLFRLATRKAFAGLGNVTNRVQLRLADQVRALDHDSVLQCLPVTLEGVVAWADPGRKFIYLLDSSGGIRVMQSRFASGKAIEVAQVVKVEGKTAQGEFAPVVTNATVRQTGTLNLPDAPQIGFEEALTGTADGRWIQMRGYVREVVPEADSVKLKLAAPGGEFLARVPRTKTTANLQGSVILVRGVCVVTANARRQLTGIEIWSPSANTVQIEQSPPADLFALPKRSLVSLRQFNLFNALNERVRTAGSVTLQVPGRYLYVQDGDSSLFAMSDQTEPLRPGDLVEVVGFPGTAGGNFLLRNAVYRRLASGPEPPAVQLPVQQSLDEDLDGRLVRAEGTLFDMSEKPDETHLMIQANGVTFEANLDQAGKVAGKRPALASRLALTGVYRLQRDEHGTPRSFQLNLRDENDIQLLAPPPWWTFSRLLCRSATAAHPCPARARTAQPRPALRHASFRYTAAPRRGAQPRTAQR